MARQKMDKTDYPTPEGGFTEWPADWDSSKHKPLKAEDFANEAAYWSVQADKYREKLEHCEEMTKLCTQFPDREQRKAASAAVRKLTAAKKMLAQLRKSGISDEDLKALAAMGS